MRKIVDDASRGWSVNRKKDKATRDCGGWVSACGKMTNRILASWRLWLTETWEVMWDIKSNRKSYIYTQKVLFYNVLSLILGDWSGSQLNLPECIPKHTASVPVDKLSVHPLIQQYLWSSYYVLVPGISKNSRVPDLTGLTVKWHGRGGMALAVPLGMRAKGGPIWGVEERWTRPCRWGAVFYFEY